MNTDEQLQPALQTSVSMPLPQNPSSPQQQLHTSPSLAASEPALHHQQQFQHSPQSLQSSSTSSGEFPQGDDVQSASSPKSITLPARIGSTGSQLISPVGDIRKRTGRRVLHRPRPLDLDYTKLNWRSSQQQQQLSSNVSGAGSEQRPMSALPVLISSSTGVMAGAGVGAGVGTGLDGLGVSMTKESKHKSKFPLLQIRTDLNPSTSFPRTSTVPGLNIGSTNNTSIYNSAQFGNPGASNINEVQRKEPSKWQIGLERILKKIQRRKRAPSNLIWYAAHSTELYLSGATLDTRPGGLKYEADSDVEGLYFGHDRPPQWALDSLQSDALFFSDDTVELMLELRDYLIKSTDNGWDIAELKEEIFPTDSKSIFHSRRNRSVSPHGSPRRTSPVAHTPGPVSPGAVSQDSGTSSRRNSKSSFDLDHLSQHVATDRYADEETGSYQLLDYFMAILSDIISHDCRYRVQNPRPTRPEWVLHSVVLDTLLFLSKAFAYDHKAIYDIGMIALSAFPVFKSNALIRLLDLLTDMILPSFALSRTQPFGAPPLSANMSPTHVSGSATPFNTNSPMSPSEIRVQLDNNQTFAIQVHSPTEEQGMLAVPREGGQSFNSLSSTHMPSSRWSSTSLSKAVPVPTMAAQDTMDTHASSLISLTLLAILQQTSISKSPLPVAKQLEKSIGDLLRIKPDISADLLQVIAVVENEKVMQRALEILWWIGKPSLGHHTLGEKLFPLDYEYVLMMRQSLNEWNAAPITATMGSRNNTVKSDVLFALKRGPSFLDESLLPRSDMIARHGTAGSFGIRSKLSYRPSLPWKSAHGTEPMSSSSAQQQQATAKGTQIPGTDYLADHELYPYLFSSPADNNNTHHQGATPMSCCERCEQAVRGFGLYCYHCRGALHLECYYSLQRYAGVDCMELGCALDHISRRPRSQLIYPSKTDNVFEESTSQIFKMRAGHHLQLVNLFSTCLCAACKMPLWGHHHQAYRCQDCGQLMHLGCNSTDSGVQDCCAATQPVALRHSFPIRIGYNNLRKSFLEFYRGLVSTWESLQSTGVGMSPATPSSTSPSAATHLKDRYSYEEASCNASALTLQLELLKTGIARGEIQVQEWEAHEGQAIDETLMASSGFELLTLQKYFVDIVQSFRNPPGVSSLSPSPLSLFLTDFFEDREPDQFLLFSVQYWSHIAALSKTMIKDAELAQMSHSNSQHHHHHHHFLSSPIIDSSDAAATSGEDIFAVGPDAMQEQLLGERSVHTNHISLATLFRFCMRRLGFQSPWTMQLILQEWVKVGLLERLDGDLCLFESAVLDPTMVSPPLPPVAPLPVASSPSLSPNTASRAGNGYSWGGSGTLPTFQTSYFDSFGNRSNNSADISSIANTSNLALVRNVHCLFPIVTAIDPTSDVENLIHSIWRCLSSVDISVNECGFLLLTRQGWPDPFMSEYTTERLLGCVFHWLLLEDDQLFVIHKNYTSKGKKIPGVRHDLDEQMAMKRAALSSIVIGASGVNLFSSIDGVTNEPATTGTATNSATSGNTGNSTTAGANGTHSHSIETNANSRSNSANSNLFGAVGSYVITRKLMAKKFALPWLKQVMDLDPKGYLDMAYRQIRILEREMAPEGEEDCATEEKQQQFRQAQAERYLESIAKLRNAGFIFTSFSNILCRWLEDVEGLLEDMDISSKGFKALNRLFAKASATASNSSRSGSGIGQDIGQTSALNGWSIPASVHQATFGSGVGGSPGSGDNEWRNRLRAKLQQGSIIGGGSIRNNSTASQDRPATPVSDTVAHNQQQQLDEAAETPLTTLRAMLRSTDDQDRREGLEKALFWLDMMVQSSVQVPIQAFMDCCEGLVDIAQKSSVLLTSSPSTNPPANVTPAVDAASPAISIEQPTTMPSVVMISQLLERSKGFLKTCWVHITSAAHRMSETEASEILDTVLTTNRDRIFKVMNEGVQSADTKDLENVREMLKFALAIVMYIYGCPLQIILSLEIAPSVKSLNSQQGRHSLPRTGAQLSLQQQLHHRQQLHSLPLVELSRNAVPINIFLSSLRSPSLSLQGEVVKGLAAILEHAQRVSNMDEFADSIHKEIVPCLWELLSPVNDHMADTTLSLLMQFISHRPGFFHKTVARYFSSSNWETRFSALDSVFGLFSKLDDALVVKLFFQQSIPTTSPLGTMLGSKGKGVDKGQNQKDRDRQQQHHTRTGTSSFGPTEDSESSGTGLSGQARKGDYVSSAESHNQHQHQSSIHQQQQQEQQYYQQALTYSQFLPEHFQILGPVFSFFVSSIWDKEEAVRTKAKTLLKSLQPVHVCHALKAWELYFITSPPEVQQTLLKLMTRLNNYFPGWKIMEYGLVFKLLTTGGLGRFVTNGSDASSAGVSETDSAASSIRGDRNAERVIVGAPTDSYKTPKSRERESREMKAKRASFASLSLWDTPGGILSNTGDGDERQAHSQSARTSSISISSEHDELSAVDASPPTIMAFMPAGEPSRRQQRMSIASTVKSVGTFASSEPAMATGAGAHEKQLELEDDIHCSLLNLALQMVANGIEPRLDEVIQLKYLVVFYLDFEGCELLSLGHGKFQVRYGEYIPRQRASPIYDVVIGDCGGLNGANVLLNDPGHENFVLAICRNLQLILDRYVEIKPDNEKDPPTLYDRLRSRDMAYDGGTMSGDPQMQSPQAARTFSAATAATADMAKESTRVTSSGLQEGDEEYDQEHHSRRQGLFRFPRSKNYQDDHHTGDSFNQQSTVLPFGQYAPPRYQQHQHHHYRRNQSRRMDDNTPVVGTYFVDVVLRFFGSETDLSVLPASRLKNWLELLLIVIYKYVKEADPLSDLIIVLMKRIIEMLMVKKGGHATSAAVATHGAAVTGGSGGVIAATDPGNNASVATAAGEESMSEENTLLAISICSTLLKRSSTMTTALLSKEIMAMGKLMTRRREDPEDPVLVRAMNFLHDAFVHFIGNGLFVLVFKTQPAHNTNSSSWEEEGQEVDQELDLFYVLATVLGEDEMVSPDPTNTAASAHLVHFRDQPIRDILDRVTIFRDLEPVQVSTILTNLALYVERVHSKFEDPHLLPDIGQFLIKVSKYTAEWDHQQQQKHKEHAQQHRQAQEQLQHRLLLQQQLQMKLHGKRRASNNLLSGNTSTVVSNGSSAHQQLQQQQKQKYREKSEMQQQEMQQQEMQQQEMQQQEMQQQKQGVMSMTSGSTIIGAGEPTATVAKSPQQSPFVGTQGQNIATSATITPTMGTSPSSSSSSTPIPHGQKQSQQQPQQTQQSTVLSSVTLESSPPPPPPISRPSFVRQKSNLLKNMASFDRDSNPFSKSRQNRQNGAHDESQASSIYLQNHLYPHRHLHQQHPHRSHLHPHHPQHQGVIKHWHYSNPILGMCAILMIQNPLEGHHLISAVKHVLRQALYRDKISAPALIRLVTGYCYMAELDFSLSLVNVFGEFVVEELKTSIQNHMHVKHDDEQALRDDEDGDEDLENYVLRPNRQGRFKKNGKGNDKEKESPLEAVGGHGGAGGVGGVNLGFGGGGFYTGGRTKILASNLHLLHHLLIWDLDPSYNLEWTSIKWDILGAMRFPPGHPILFPGANDALRQETASIVSDWVDRDAS